MSQEQINLQIKISANPAGDRHSLGRQFNSAPPLPKLAAGTGGASFLAVNYQEVLLAPLRNDIPPASIDDHMDYAEQ